ncbi:Pep3/Vps18/deep orange family-domain-containing protein [Globomyces pollinis-pini]|nr:Pep3/Vps18/deep orange family-domain-containing protein [Globomyces pollinis-pini]
MRILWIDLDKPNSIVDIYIKTKDICQIESLFFQDVLIVSTTADENYVISTDGKPRLLSRIKERITAIAWPVELKRSSIGPILVGTITGSIFELELSLTDKKLEKALDKIYSGDEPITGLSYFSVLQRVCVYVATNNRLYQFVGHRISANDYQFAQLLKDETNADCQEMMGAPLHSELILYRKFSKKHTDSPELLVWLTAAGIYCGNVTLNSLKHPGDSTLDGIQLQPYPTIGDIEYAPISCKATDFHYIILTQKKCIVMNRLNNSFIHDLLLPLNVDETPIELAMDINRKTYWVATNQSLFEIIITNEDRDIWRIYLNKKQYKDAYEIAKVPEDKQLVAKHHADYEFTQKNYSFAAELYARSSLSLEEVSLKLLSLDSTKALQLFLNRKISSLKPGDISQTILIGTWLVELILADLDTEEDREAQGTSVVNLLENKQIIMDKLQSFLKTYHARLNAQAIYSLLKQHGREDQQLFFAELIKDSDCICLIHLKNGSWSKALDIIGKQTNAALYYKHSPLLIQHIPHDTITLWIRSHFLNPRLLLPAMIHYANKRHKHSTDENEVIKYLEYVISNGNDDRVIHNYLLQIYVNEGESYFDRFMKFISDQHDHPIFDVQYALRICLQENMMVPCVKLYSMLNMEEEAIMLALKNDDIELAKIIVSKIDEDLDLKQKLWLQIAKHVVEKKDFQNALSFCKEGDLKIEQVLQFFPDFVLIDNLKKDLCQALVQYNDQLTKLTMELDESARNSELIQMDIKNIKTKYAIVPIMKKCDLCNRPLMTRQFHVFPCHHAFHSDCLSDVLLKDLAKGTRIKYYQSNMAKNPAMKDSLEQFIAEECVLCGDLLIKNIDVVLTTDPDLL